MRILQKNLVTLWRRFACLLSERLMWTLCSKTLWGRFRFAPRLMICEPSGTYVVARLAERFDKVVGSKTRAVNAFRSKIKLSRKFCLVGWKLNSECCMFSLRRYGKKNTSKWTSFFTFREKLVVGHQTCQGPILDWLLDWSTFYISNFKRRLLYWVKNHVQEFCKNF